MLFVDIALSGLDSRAGRYLTDKIPSREPPRISVIANRSRYGLSTSLAISGSDGPSRVSSTIPMHIYQYAGARSRYNRAASPGLRFDSDDFPFHSKYQPSYC